MRPQLPPRPAKGKPIKRTSDAHSSSPAAQPPAEAGPSQPPSSDRWPQPAGQAAGQAGGAPPPAAAVAGGAVPPAAWQAVQAAMSGLASGQDQDVLAGVGSKLGLTGSEVQQVAAAMASGTPPTQLPAALLERITSVHRAASGFGPLGAGGFPGDEPDSSQGLLDDDDAEQSWLSLYARAYLTHADAAYPPLFAALCAALFAARLLPFWLALGAVPVAYVLGVHLVIVKGAGVPTMMVPLSRMTASLVASLEVAAVGTFLLGMLRGLADAWAQCALMLAAAGAALYLHYRTAALDAGALPAARLPAPLTHAQRLAFEAGRPGWCSTCIIYRPIRSKHCAACDRCFAEFDHHCPVVHNCVAAGNRREFVGYLILLWVAELLWLRLGLLFLRRALQAALRAEALPAGRQVLAHAFALGRRMPGTMYMCSLVVLIFCGTSYLLGRQLACVAAGLTTNELLGRRKYGYLQAADGVYSNPFDEGPVANCLTFWRTARPDWYRVYSERQQKPPPARRWALSTFFRRWDLARRSLEEARLARRRRREEWLLSTYGGGGARPGRGGDPEAGEQAVCAACPGHG